MSPEQIEFLTLPHWPAVWDRDQVSYYSGFLVYEIEILMSKGFLPPIGDPAQNGKKLWAAVTVMRHCQNPAWLSRARKIIGDEIKDGRNGK